MSIEAMKQAADQLEIGLAYPGMRFYHDKIRAAITALRTAIEQAETVSLQVSPADFVDVVMGKEDATGKPIFWAEWPNRERNHD